MLLYIAFILAAVTPRDGSIAFTFDHLQPGTYTVTVRGDGPLEVATTKVHVANNERQRASLVIHPRPVAGTVSLGSKPLANTKLVFFHKASGWEAEVTTDAQGRFTANVWQPGEVLVSARGGALTSNYMTSAELREGRFDLVVPDHRVGGRLVDGASGRGVPNAQVFLRSTHGETRSTVRAITDAEGAFAFNAVAPGQQRVTVIASDYVIPAAVDFTTRDGDPPYDTTIALDSGTPRTLRIYGRDGRPAAGVEVDAAVDGEIRAMATSDAEGRVTIPLPPGKEATIYAIPHDGAFAIAAKKSDRVDLPPPSSSLRILTRSLDGTPIADVALLMSFDGVVIPPSIARRIQKVQGLALMSNTAGEVMLRNIPPGSYQFWPYRGEEEAQAIIASGFEAPISLNVKTGENTVSVDFMKQMR